jgi:hypothetical protein
MIRTARAGRRTAPLLAVLLLAASCNISQTPASSGSGQPGAAGPVPAGVVVASGHGWSSAGLAGPFPAAGTCHVHTATDGEPLPDPACTPGAIDSAVSNATASTTVCRKGGYTSSVRPPESLTAPAKLKLMAAYGIPASQVSGYELDHLVELNSGGASDTRNLWPEPDTFRQFHQSGFIHNDKDAVEEYTFRALCQHKTTVSAIEAAMATDWTTAVARLGLPPVPAGYQG